MKTLVVVPTYNEAENIEKIVFKILNFPFVELLVIDDNSPDGTSEIVSGLMKKLSRLHLIKRDKKKGLGTAYIKGFKWGLQRDFEVFFEMDADLSHNPNDLPLFLKEIEKGYDVVVGSRYLNGTISVVGWDFKRLLLSKFGNFYAGKLLNLSNFTDLTSGYRCYTKKALKMINLDSINSNGYAFQIEMLYRAYKKGLKIKEIPIIFYERETGGSKMSKKIVFEAMVLPFKLKFQSIFKKEEIKMEVTINGCKLKLVQGDITKQDTEVIVNAANSSLLGGGGVDGAIHRAGGPAILEECKKIREKIGGYLPTGEAVITTAGNLPAKKVIHTVGPIYGRDKNPEKLLANAYKNSLALALKEGYKSISFPSISTGAYGYPVNEASKIALRTVIDFLKNNRGLEEVRFVLFGDKVFNTYKNSLKEILADA